MCRIASISFLQRLKGSMSGDARDFNNMEMRTVIKFLFFLQGKAPKEIHVILKETLGEHAPSYDTVKNWVAQFKRGDFSTCDAPRPGRSKTVTTPEISDHIHQLILENGRILAKSIAEQLGISHERVGSIIHEDLDMRKLSAKWVPKCLNMDQKISTVPVVWATFGIFSARSKWFPVAIGDHGRNLVISLLAGDKATINGVAALCLTLPQKIPSAKIRWKSSRLNFWDQEGMLINYLPKGQTINMEYYPSLLVQFKDLLKEKCCKILLRGLISGFGCPQTVTTALEWQFGSQSFCPLAKIRCIQLSCLQQPYGTLKLDAGGSH